MDNISLLLLPYLVYALHIKIDFFRSRILEETKPSQPTQKQLIRKPKLLNEHVVAEHCDRGPFFGLPDRVRQLYREVKGITELFPWQNACLNSEAVQAKKNLLYSLPTSGGKTLVAEIIMLQVSHEKITSRTNYQRVCFNNCSIGPNGSRNLDL